MEEISSIELSRKYFSELAVIAQNGIPHEEVSKAADAIVSAYEKGGRVYICGNGGGGAAFAANLALDLSQHPFVSSDKSKPLPKEIQGFSAYDLVNCGAALTGLTNDFGPEYMFSRQLENYGLGREDVVVAVSGSGNSKNVVKAFEIAKNRGAKTIGITRRLDGKIKPYTDHYIYINVGETTFPGQTGGNVGNFYFEALSMSVSDIFLGAVVQRVLKKVDSLERKLESA